MEAVRVILLKIFIKLAAHPHQGRTLDSPLEVHSERRGGRWILHAAESRIKAYLSQPRSAPQVQRQGLHFPMCTRGSSDSTRHFAAARGTRLEAARDIVLSWQADISAVVNDFAGTFVDRADSTAGSSRAIPPCKRPSNLSKRNQPAAARCAAIQFIILSYRTHAAACETVPAVLVVEHCCYAILHLR